jgi:RNA polymerase sigma-70 factor (ECF subfamily)
MPDAWLAAIDEDDASARYTLKESVALAFVAALQSLTPMQRATLLLRDVVGLSAEETAAALETGIGAANSALFRARQAVEEKCAPRAELGAPVDEALLARYVRAFESRDLDAFVALLHDDVVTTMPPRPMWLAGLAANTAFYARMFEGPISTGLRTLVTSANGQTALGYYRPEQPGVPFTLHAIQVLTVRAGGIARIDHFMMKESFAAFGLPLNPP